MYIYIYIYIYIYWLSIIQKVLLGTHMTPQAKTTVIGVDINSVPYHIPFQTYFRLSYHVPRNTCRLLQKISLWLFAGTPKQKLNGYTIYINQPINTNFFLCISICLIYIVTPPLSSRLAGCYSCPLSPPVNAGHRRWLWSVRKNVTNITKSQAEPYSKATRRVLGESLKINTANWVAFPFKYRVFDKHNSSTKK